MLFKKKIAEARKATTATPTQNKTVDSKSKPVTSQSYKAFFDFTSNRRYKGRLPERPSDDSIRMLLAENNSSNPFSNVVFGQENRGNMNTLRDFVFTVLSRVDRRANDCSFGIFAQSGQGKSHVVRVFAKATGLALVNVPSKTLKSVDDLFKKILLDYSRASFDGDALFESPAEVDKSYPEIVRLDRDDYQYKLPPMIVFLDEAHAIPKSMMQAGLLTAMERDDHHMVVKYEGETVTVDTSNVCWVLATTEKGMLFDAFINRMSALIEWQNAGPEELAKIVSMTLKKRVDSPLPDSLGEAVAEFKRVPREAISFAENVVKKKRMIPSLEWTEACKEVASDMGIDEWGLNQKQVAILTALGQRPIAESRLSTVAGCRIEQVRTYELPELMSYDNGGPFVVSSSRGMCITEAGLVQLELRGIEHNGNKITAEHFENKK